MLPVVKKQFAFAFFLIVIFADNSLTRRALYENMQSE